MKLYIAGPMSGLPEFNYPAFHTAEGRLIAAGYETLNPAKNEELNPTPGTPQAWPWYMRRALIMMLQADGLALLWGWSESRGAKLEIHIAQQLGLPFQMADVWIADSL